MIRSIYEHQYLNNTNSVWLKNRYANLLFRVHKRDTRPFCANKKIFATSYKKWQLLIGTTKVIIKQWFSNFASFYIYETKNILSSTNRTDKICQSYFCIFNFMGNNKTNFPCHLIWWPRDLLRNISWKYLGF